MKLYKKFALAAALCAVFAPAALIAPHAFPIDFSSDGGNGETAQYAAFYGKADSAGKVAEIGLAGETETQAAAGEIAAAQAENYEKTAEIYEAGGELYSASESDPYYSPTRFEFLSYSVSYDVESDRTMDVTLDVTAHYLGTSSTGFIYDIPVNGGDRVRNLKAYKLDGGEEDFLEYSIERDDENFISVYMDDYRIKYGETHSYRIKYEYAITKPTDKNHLYLNAIGFGSAAPIYDIMISFTLPDGLEDVSCYVGKKGEDSTCDYFIRTGNTVTMALLTLGEYRGVTFDFAFEEGALTVRTDMTPYWIIIGACGLLVLILALKLLIFNKNDITPVPCFSVPANLPNAEGGTTAYSDDPTAELDPLMMGKLIDNKVDKSDVTSLLYYWAAKGYIKINMQNEDDIVLIRICQRIPEDSPDYQKTMYYGLFADKTLVHLNDLKETFYPTVERVTKQVNAESDSCYDGKSMAAAIFFALLGGLVMGLPPILIAMFMINIHLLVIAPMFVVIPVFAVFALTQSVKYRTLKYSRKKMFLLYAGVALLCALFSGLYILIVPSYVIEILPAFLLAAVGFAVVMTSVTLICRTKEYSAKLDRIVGFKQFIETVEKDKLEMMLEGNPEFYYNVLPYANVLGVSDIWEKKFEGLTLAPPAWAVGNFTAGDVLDIMILNSLMRNLNMRMLTTFVSRPSSGSMSGNFGSFGGFGGGGHGGGGFRGK